MKTRPFIVFAALPAGLCLAVAVRGEGDEAPAGKGSITGRVVDAAGAPAGDVIVVAQEAAKKMRKSLDATTAADGSFTILDVPAGDYNLKLRTRDGRAKGTRSVTVLEDRTTDVGTLKLKPA